MIKRKYDAQAVGKRKTSVARVYLAKGTGQTSINDRSLPQYFGTGRWRFVVKQSLKVLGLEDLYDVYVNVEGGGPNGQAEAIRLGISRALVKLMPERRPELKKEGLLTRDSRKVERKKYGLHGARRSCQYSKR